MTFARMARTCQRNADPIPGSRCDYLRVASLVGLLLVILAWPVSARVVENHAELCDLAAQRASTRYDVPLSVLRAITLTETGRSRDGAFEPWPWTVNVEGAGAWFDDATSALDHVKAARDLGKRSFDVGCFQLNYRWHGDAFASLEDMFDPARNAAYAAWFLRSLFEEFGTWTDAAGAYHSRTPEFANRYKSRFQRILASLGDPLPTRGPTQAAAPDLTRPSAAMSAQYTPPRENRYPLLLAQQAPSAIGSLVPLSSQFRAGPLAGSVSPLN